MLTPKCKHFSKLKTLMQINVHFSRIVLMYVCSTQKYLIPGLLMLITKSIKCHKSE